MHRTALPAPRPLRSRVQSRTPSRDIARRIARLALLAIVAVAAPAAVAQGAYPAKPVRLIVSSGAGSSPDIQSRIFTAELGKLWGLQFVIENVAGAAGNIAAERVAKSPADGYTLLYASAGPLQFNKSLYPRIAYDIESDFEPIMLVGRVPNVLAVHPSLPVTTVAELIAYAKANPGKLRYGSSGSGGSQHLSGELFQYLTGTKMVHVPYKQSAQMTTELVGGMFELTFQNAPVILPYVKSGQVRAIAVTSARRSPYLPNVPTVAEASPSLAAYEIGGRTGLLAPKGTSQAIVAKIHADVLKVLALPNVREQFAANGVEIVGNKPAELGKMIHDETARWAPLIKQWGTTVD